MKAKLFQATLWLGVWCALGCLIWLFNQPRASQAQLEAEYLARLAKQTPTPLPPTPEPTPFRVTLAHYERLKNGLTLAQCNVLIGMPGQELSRAGAGEYEVVTVSWVNRSGSNLTATFQGGRLMAKAQLGLQ